MLKSVFTQISKDPFRLHFPIALSFAVYACLAWMAYSFFDQGEYPGQLHAELFIGGYLYFSIYGFLMTAVPRFTEADLANLWDILFSLIIFICAWGSILLHAELFFWSSLTLGQVHLMFFALKRFRKRKQNPPYTFLFVGLGMTLGIVGTSNIIVSLILSLADINLSFDFERLGKLLFYDAAILALIIGIGGRLIPGILGFEEIVEKQKKIYEKPLAFIKIIPLEIFIGATFFAISFILEFLDYTQVGYIIRSLVVSFIAFKHWRIQRRSEFKKWHATFLKISCWIVLLTHWCLVFFPELNVDLKHLIYIGGYTLITFLVATRVVLAHGDSGLGLEQRFYPSAILGGLLVFAALTRATATFIESSYMNHLGYTAFLYLSALVLWGIVFFPKIFIQKT